MLLLCALLVVRVVCLVELLLHGDTKSNKPAGMCSSNEAMLCVCPVEAVQGGEGGGGRVFCPGSNTSRQIMRAPRVSSAHGRLWLLTRRGLTGQGGGGWMVDG